MNPADLAATQVHEISNQTVPPNYRNRKDSSLLADRGVIIKAAGVRMMQVIARLRLVFVLVCLVVGPLAAQEPATEADPLKDKVQQLLGELDGKTLAGRNQAEKDLIELGHDALQHLPPDDAPLSPEAKQRLTRVRAKIATTNAKVEVQSAEQDDWIDRCRHASARRSKRSVATVASSLIIKRMMTNRSVPTRVRCRSGKHWTMCWIKLSWIIDFYGSEDATLALVPRAEKRPSRFDSAAYADAFRLEPTIVTSRRVLSDESLSGMTWSCRCHGSLICFL